jgi:hypothetical protein
LFLVVRCRAKGDLEALFPKAMAVEDTRNEHDYRWRGFVPRGVVAKVVAKEIGQISYGNFKDCVTDKRRLPYYLECWSVLAAMQEDLHTRPGHTEIPTGNDTKGQ